MPSVPYFVEGVVKKGPLQDYTETNTTIVQADGGATLNLILGSGTSIGSSLTVTLYNATTGESITTTSDASGNYALDAANLASGYTDGDSIRVSVSDLDSSARTNVNDSMHNFKKFQVSANADRNLLSDRRGNEFTSNYPLPVEIANDIISSQNPSSILTYSGGNLSTETLTIRGLQYRKTYAYDGGGNLTSESAWNQL